MSSTADETRCARCAAMLGPADVYRSFGYVRCSTCRAIYDHLPLPAPFLPPPRPGDRCPPLGRNSLVVRGEAGTSDAGAGLTSPVRVVLALMTPFLLVFVALLSLGHLSSQVRIGATIGLIAFVGLVIALTRGARRGQRRVRLLEGAVQVEDVGTPGKQVPTVARFTVGEISGVFAREYDRMGRPPANGMLEDRRYEVVAIGADGREVPLVHGEDDAWTALFAAQEVARTLNLPRTASGWGESAARSDPEIAR